MPSDDRLRLAQSAFEKPIRSFLSTLATTADEVRRHLLARQSTWDGVVARVSAELGPLAAGRINAERFATLAVDRQSADPIAIEAIERALATLTDLAARADALCRVEVPPGGSLYEAVARALGEVGRAFSAARLAAEVRAGRAGTDTRAVEALPFSRWTRNERRAAPPLVVAVGGADLRAAALAEFLDGRQKIVLVVEGECAPAPLVRLVAPGTFVLQTNDGAGLDRLARWDGPGLAALVPDSAARFVHDPAAGAAPCDRITIAHAPDRVPRKAIGGLSAAQQMEELELLRSLAARPGGAAPGGAEPAAVAVAAGGAASDPADKLADWLLSKVNLSDLG